MNVELSSILQRGLFHNYSLKMERLQNRFTNKHFSKQNQQSVSICNYYLKTLFPSIFKAQSYPAQDSTNIRVIHRNIAYNYSRQTIRGIEDIKQQAIIQAAKTTYFANLTSRIKQNSYFKSTTIKIPYFPVWAEISQQIEIFTISQDYDVQQIPNNAYRSPNKTPSNNELQRKKSHPLLSAKRSQEPNKNKVNISLYIVHYSKNMANDSNFQWENFIQKYKIVTSPNQGQANQGQATTILTYETVFSYSVEKSLIDIKQTQKILQMFYQKSVFDQKDYLKHSMTQKLINKLKSLTRVEKTKLNQELQSPSFDTLHRRELRLTQDQKIIYNRLKVKTFAHFGAVNRKRQMNRYFLENLICRMMSNQDYKQDQSWEAIKYYIEFQKRMRDKYKWSSFQKYDKMNIFTYIGKDMFGRPILFNRIRNNLMSKIQNFDQYFDYHLYLFEIYLQDKMQGWVDQFIVLSDASNQVSDNTNLGFTKRLVTQSFKLIYGRIAKIIVFDIGFIGYALYRILKPLLPSSFIEIIKIIGDDRAELLQQLRQSMSDEAIPEFLGGKNKTLETLPSPQQRQNTDMTSDQSIKNPARSMKRL